MAENNEKFVLYEYLKFFWDKKIILFLIPLILALLAFGYTKFTEKRLYSASTIVYLGSVENKSLLLPDLVKSEYEDQISEQLTGGFQAELANNRMILKLTGQVGSSLEQELNKATTKYYEDLVESFEYTKVTQAEFVDLFKQKIDNMETNVALYKEQLQQEETDILLTRLYLNLIQTEEDLLLDYTYNFKDAKSKLENLEEPKILDTVVSQQSSYLLPNIFVSLLFGFFLSFLLLTLWKYIIDAKRVLKERKLL